MGREKNCPIPFIFHFEITQTLGIKSDPTMERCWTPGIKYSLFVSWPYRQEVTQTCILFSKPMLTRIIEH